MFNCSVCHHTAFNAEFVSEVFALNGRRVLVEHIPAQVCAHCGEATFTRETTEAIRRLIHDAKQPIRTEPLEVFAMA